VLKKTAVTGGLLIAAAGALVTTCSPVFATTAQLPSNHNRNWNGSENQNYNRIRLHIHNRNNNIAVARTHERDRDRGRPRGMMTELTPPTTG
jgi:hypothetical protein